MNTSDRASDMPMRWSSVIQSLRIGGTRGASSKQPSLDKKARRESARPGGARLGHKGHFRTLAGDPGETIDHLPDTCPHCQTRLDARLCGEVTGEYDEIDLARGVSNYLRDGLSKTL
ncbi:MAG: hypothetical protein IIB62_11030 [Proteobacteria bacterium]|nr:hypothetical protein [Pseudomonadota bacterium]